MILVGSFAAVYVISIAVKNISGSSWKQQLNPIHAVLFLAGVIYWKFCSILYTFGVVSALIYNAYNKNKGMDGIPWGECFSIFKMMSFVIGWSISFIPTHILDQYVIRLYSKECRNCFKLGECSNEENELCGCPPYQKACSPFERCRGYWDPVVFDREAWEKQIRENPFDLTIKF